IPAGRALNVLRRMTDASWEEIDRAVDALPETDLVVDLSFFPNAFGRRGRMDNIHEGNFTSGDLFLAAYENMTGNYAAAARRLFPSGEWGSLALSGGLVHRSRRLRQLLGQRLERDYRVSPSEDDALVGLACLAGVIAGYQPSVAGAIETLRGALETR